MVSTCVPLKATGFFFLLVNPSSTFVSTISSLSSSEMTSLLFSWEEECNQYDHLSRTTSSFFDRARERPRKKSSCNGNCWLRRLLQTFKRILFFISLSWVWVISPTLLSRDVKNKWKTCIASWTRWDET